MLFLDITAPLLVQHYAPKFSMQDLSHGLKAFEGPKEARCIFGYLRRGYVGYPTSAPILAQQGQADRSSTCLSSVMVGLTLSGLKTFAARVGRQSRARGECVAPSFSTARFSPDKPTGPGTQRGGGSQDIAYRSTRLQGSVFRSVKGTCSKRADILYPRTCALKQQLRNVEKRASPLFRKLSLHSERCPVPHTEFPRWF